MKISDVYTSLKYYIQRSFRGYSDYQVIELFSSEASHILPILKGFREHTECIPPAFAEWAPEYGVLQGEYEASPDYVGGGFEAWLETIDNIIWSFTFLVAQDEPTTRKEKVWVKEFKELNGDKWYMGCPNFDTEVYSEYSSKCQKGLELYGKHYLSLWL